MDQSLEDVFVSLKNKIAENKLSLKEVAANTQADEELIAIILDDSSQVVKTVSDLLNFMKFKIKSRELNFKVYKIRTYENQVKITRIIHPRCHIYFDKPTQKFFKFEMKYKREKVSDTYKQLIINDMVEFYKKNT
jgi:hypothetical protein